MLAYVVIVVEERIQIKDSNSNKFLSLISQLGTSAESQTMNANRPK